MKALLFLMMIPLVPISCFKSRVYYNYDEFENKHKMMMEQMYTARKDFKKKESVRIKYYKEFDQSGLLSLSGKINFHTSPSDGKLGTKLSIKVKNEVFDAIFYDGNTEKISSTTTKSQHTIDYKEKESENDKDDDKEISSETHTNTSTTNTYINNISYFNFDKKIIDKLLADKDISFRFYVGKEGVTVYLSKRQLNSMLEFIQSTSTKSRRTFF
ncbi:MAG: hypothetical protein B6I20_00020 [Bacteroidetes bacterium 4572_117]|nr:MAG: hypothetical protein B6I20_00020 [Bacteroidetes bacterium 4572_117]